MSDNSDQIYAIDAWDSFDSNIIGTSDVNVTVDGKQYTVSVTVTAYIASIKSITVEQNSELPTEVTAVMSDNSEHSYSVDAWGSFDSSVIGTSDAIVTVEEKQYTVSVTVIAYIRSIKPITVKQHSEAPTEVTAVMSDNSEQSYTVDSWGSFSSNATGTNDTTITIDGKQYTVTVTVIVYIKSIKPITVEQGLDAPIEVTAVMSDDTEKVYTVDSWGDDLDLTNIGTNEVTVTIDGKPYTISITVTEPTIVSIKRMEVERNATLPNEVVATMSNGTEKVYPVESWSEADLSSPGEVNITVTINGTQYDISVTVKEPTIVSIKPLTVETDSELPTKVTAMMSDGSEADYDVEGWEDVDLSTETTVNLKCNINGVEYEVSMTIVKVTIVSLNAITMDRTLTRDLPTEVTAVVSYGPDRTYTVNKWSDFNVDAVELGEHTVVATIDGTEYNVTVTVKESARKLTNIYYPTTISKSTMTALPNSIKGYYNGMSMSLTITEWEDAENFDINNYEVGDTVSYVAVCAGNRYPLTMTIVE